MNFKKIFVLAYAKEDRKDIAMLLYTHNLSPVFYEDEHPYSDEIQGMEINVHTAGIFNCGAESALKYNAIAVPSTYIGNPDIHELINYCIVKKVTVFVFDKMGECTQPGWWDADYVSRFDHGDTCTQNDTPAINAKTVIQNEQAEK
jgi:hypothetical protein